MNQSQTLWVVDPSHSEIGFKVKHLVISSVRGSFDVFDAKLTYGQADFSDAKISFSAQVASINTRNEQRDGHLKSADFFDAENFPVLTFESSQMQVKSGNTYVLEGNLTIKGQTKSIQLDIEHHGHAIDPFAQVEKTGFSIKGKISRKEFGLTWSMLTEAGGMVVGDQIELLLEVEMVKQ